MILAYPFSIANDGSAQCDSGVKAQLKMLLGCTPGTRLTDDQYGFNSFGLEQEAINDDISPERTMFIVALTQKMALYIPDALITDVTFERGDTEQVINANISYVVGAKEDEIVWQPLSSLSN